MQWDKLTYTEPGCTGIWMSILCYWKGWAQDQVGVGGGRLQTTTFESRQPDRMAGAYGLLLWRGPKRPGPGPPPGA